NLKIRDGSLQKGLQGRKGRQSLRARCSVIIVMEALKPDSGGELMDSTADLQTIGVRKKISTIPDVGVAGARSRDRGARRTSSDRDSARPGTCHKRQPWSKGRLWDGINVVSCAREADAERIEYSRRNNMRMVQTQHLHVERETRPE